MALFDPGKHTHSRKSREIYAAFEIAYTLVDFAAAMLFVIGSILFFGEETQHLGTWLFLIGSVCFALKPTLRLVRELRYLRAGKINTLAERADD